MQFDCEAGDFPAHTLPYKIHACVRAARPNVRLLGLQERVRYPSLVVDGRGVVRVCQPVAVNDELVLVGARGQADAADPLAALLREEELRLIPLVELARDGDDPRAGEAAQAEGDVAPEARLREGELARGRAPPPR